MVRNAIRKRAKQVLKYAITKYWLYLAKNSDYIFVAPLISRNGGAAAVGWRYITTLLQHNPKYKITVIITSSRNPVGMPKGVKIIRFPSEIVKSHREYMDNKIAEIILTTKPKALHIIEEFGFFANEQIASQIYLHSKVFLSMFLLWDPQDGGGWHLLTRNPQLIAYIDHIYTDNQYIIDFMADKYGLPRSKFTRHYQPAPLLSSVKIRELHSPLRIFWAARLDAQKRPDISVEIARQLHNKGIEAEIDIFGSHVLSNDYQAIIDDYRGYKGAFTGGLGTIAHGYDAYLSTTSIEGMPNAILEAAALGLIIIAPNVGGIGEIIKQETGYLIHDYSDIDSYVDVIQRIINKPAEAVKKAAAVKNLVRAQHSQSILRKMILSDKDYLV